MVISDLKNKNIQLRLMLFLIIFISACSEKKTDSPSEPVNSKDPPKKIEDRVLDRSFTGIASFPSDFIPEMQFCLAPVEGGKDICVKYEASEKTYAYEVKAPPGRYNFYAIVPTTTSADVHEKRYLNAKNIFTANFSEEKRIVDLIYKKSDTAPDIYNN